MNTISMLGRLTSAAIPKGTAENLGAQFTLAVQRNFRNQAGEYDADFIPCITFGKRAEFALAHLHKGERVAVTGSLRVTPYTDNSGVKRTWYEVVVDSIDFADVPHKQEPPSPAPAPSPQAAPPSDTPSPWVYPFS